MSDKDHAHIFEDIPKEAHDRAKRIGDALAYARGDAWGVAKWYEDLIDEGKLRVVGEVEAVAVPDEDNTTGGYFNEWSCSKCGHYVEHTSFCPGCGNKIKR